MLAESQMLAQLQNLMPIENIVYALYANTAYPDSDVLFRSFRNVLPGSLEAQFNTEMSHVCETVECDFKEILQQWAYLGSKPAMQVFKTAVARFYVLGVFLVNCRSCIYGNQVSKYFNLRPMTLETYLQLVQKTIDIRVLY